MADLSQTAANVKLKGFGVVSVDTAGEALTQGQPVYLSTDSKWYRCDANDTAAKAECGGLVLTPAATDGQFVRLHPGADVDIGATLTVSETYIVSATVGAIAPIGDLASASYMTSLGIATTTSTLRFDPQVSGVQKA